MTGRSLLSFTVSNIGVGTLDWNVTFLGGYFKIGKWIDGVWHDIFGGSIGAGESQTRQIEKTVSGDTPFDINISIDSNGGDSNVRVYQAVSPSPPQLINPANGTPIFANTSTTFSWTEVSGATSYDIQFDNESPIDTSGLSHWTLISDARGTHFWKVRAKGSFGTTEWSQTRWFNII